MCTVTFFPLKDGNFILTSNRDETPLRKTIPPKRYRENGVELIYPKDALAGGSWIGTSEKKRLVCLLNGGFESHKRKTSYRMSRGIIVKNILSADDGVDYMHHFNFDDIEPFTLILVDWSEDLQAFELVWDGVKKHMKRLSQEPKIWSSSTLYTDEMKELRKVWFVDFLKQNKTVYQEKIVNFHQNSTLGTPEISPKMKRNFVETVSVTSVKKTTSETKMWYLDILKNEVTTIDL